MMDNLESITFGFQRSLPEIIAWSIGIVLAIFMLRRGGGKPETLLLIGCGLFLLSSLSSLVINTVVHAMQELRISYASYSLFTGLTTGVLSLAGLVCLIWAFWTKFRKKEEVAS